MPHFITVIIYHFLSQILYKYIKLPDEILLLSENEVNHDVTQISYQQWLEFSQEVLWQLGLDPEQVTLLSQKVTKTLTQHFTMSENKNAHYITFLSDKYPAFLREICAPPHALTVLGNPDLLTEPSISVIGARKASTFALEQSQALGMLASQNNICVVSGGAYGCDIAVHRGLLADKSRNKKAVIIFAGGLDQLYPRGNLIFFNDLLQNNGCLVSERIWGAQTRSFDFPTRNRIVAGISAVTFLMQAAERSGSMITVRHALDNGRDVYVLKNKHNDARFSGSESLISEGAISFSNVLELKGLLCCGKP